MIGLVVDEVAAQKERMTLGERQTETKTFGEVVDFDKRLENQLLSLVGQAWTHILNNEEKDVVVFMDKDYEHKLMGIHPCDNTATVYVNCRDVAKLIKEHGNELHFVKM